MNMHVLPFDLAHLDRVPREVSEAESEAFLPLETIRQRVAAIKGSWTAEQAKARAIEGVRRRRELEDLFLELLCDTEGSEETCDLSEHGFSLVG